MEEGPTSDLFFLGGGPLCSNVGKEERERIGEMSQMCQQRRGREEKDGDFFEARSELGVPPRLMWPQKKEDEERRKTDSSVRSLPPPFLYGNSQLSIADLDFEPDT